MQISPLSHSETLAKISKYLSENNPDVVQYTHFVLGVYVVQAKSFHRRFSPNFLAWLDENQMVNVSFQSVRDNIYVIVVKKEN